jgi:hypothetical protein
MNKDDALKKLDAKLVEFAGRQIDVLRSAFMDASTSSKAKAISRFKEGLDLDREVYEAARTVIIERFNQGE